MAHHIKLFIVDGEIEYLHHNTDSPFGDTPGKHMRAPTGDRVRFKAPEDGGFSIEFKVESPFESRAGRPGFPIVSADGKQTGLETLIRIPTVVKSFEYTATLGGVTDDPEIIIDNSGGGGGGGGSRPSPRSRQRKRRDNASRGRRRAEGSYFFAFAFAAAGTGCRISRAIPCSGDRGSAASARRTALPRSPYTIPKPATARDL